ncbi:unnamed protein product, partial [Rotaria sp. Silwood1]
YIGIHQLPIPKEHDLIEVESSFGGIAIYQTKYIRDCMYFGYGKNGLELCEHVPFNLCIRGNGGRIFINPRRALRSILSKMEIVVCLLTIILDLASSDDKDRSGHTIDDVTVIICSCCCHRFFHLPPPEHKYVMHTD